MRGSVFLCTILHNSFAAPPTRKRSPFSLMFWKIFGGGGGAGNPTSQPTNELVSSRSEMLTFPIPNADNVENPHAFGKDNSALHSMLKLQTGSCFVSLYLMPIYSDIVDIAGGVSSGIIDHDRTRGFCPSAGEEGVSRDLESHHLRKAEVAGDTLTLTCVSSRHQQTIEQTFPESALSLLEDCVPPADLCAKSLCSGALTILSEVIAKLKEFSPRGEMETIPFNGKMFVNAGTQAHDSDKILRGFQTQLDFRSEENIRHISPQPGEIADHVTAEVDYLGGLRFSLPLNFPSDPLKLTTLGAAPNSPFMRRVFNLGLQIKVGKNTGIAQYDKATVNAAHFPADAKFISLVDRVSEWKFPMTLNSKQVYVVLSSLAEKILIPFNLGLSVDSKTVITVADSVSGLEFSTKPGTVAMDPLLGDDVVILNPVLLRLNLEIWLDAENSRVGFRVA